MEIGNLPICVIEDDKFIRRLFVNLLKTAGQEVIDFANGTSATEWLSANIPLGVIVDILLPDLNGTDILKMIRSSDTVKHLPVIAVTGFATINDRDKFLEMGFDAYIPKPVDTETFVNEVLEAITRKIGNAPTNNN